MAARVPFKDLPTGVKKALFSIRDHRREIRGFAGAGIFATGILGILSYGTFLIPLGPMWYSLYRGHDVTFRKEYEVLFHALKENAEDPRISSLLADPKAKFIIVKSDLSLVGRETAPKVFGLRIGRTRVANPLNEKVSNQWKKTYFPDFSAYRKRKRKR